MLTQADPRRGLRECAGVSYGGANDAACPSEASSAFRSHLPDCRAASRDLPLVPMRIAPGLQVCIRAGAGLPRPGALSNKTSAGTRLFVVLAPRHRAIRKEVLADEI